MAEKDRCHLEMFKEHLKFEGKISSKIVKHSTQNLKWLNTAAVEVQISSDEIFDSLGRFNIHQRKTFTNTFPELIYNHPLRHHFMRGYFDGDGSAYWSIHKKRSKHLAFSLRGTSEFLMSFRHILEEERLVKSRGIRPIRVNTNMGVLEYGGNRVLRKIGTFLYKDAIVYLNRKYNKFIELESLTKEL